MATKGRRTKKRLSCAVNDCERPAQVKGFCPYHYGRNRRGILDEQRHQPDEALPPRPKWEYLGNEAALVATQE